MVYVRLTVALGRVREDLAGLLDEASLRELCRGEGMTWRERLLDPVTTIHLFLAQILHRNTACAHIPRIAGRLFTASAYCQARARLPLRVCQALLRRLADTAWPERAGHRTWLVDGTGVSMPDTPALQRAYGQPAAQRPGCGFPVAKVLALFDSASGMLRALHTAPLGAHDLSQVPLIHPEMRPGDILIGDRAYGSFAHLAVLAGRGLHGLFRMHQKRVVDFTPGRDSPPRWRRKKLSGKPRSTWVRSLGPEDQVVEWYRPYPRAEWMSKEDHAALPLSLPVRELRYRVDRPGFRVEVVTLATTLLDAEAYPAEELAGMYLSRWQVEISRSQCDRNNTLYQVERSAYCGCVCAVGAGTLVSQAA
ncbi:IS4 family transposase [Singulisphaera sp. PoT]|uniref:IS4 family transposase n=1 Tax=Singulisphaera sp. PoT TaxID=3411797 RepID=UPI003BF4D143